MTSSRKPDPMYSLVAPDIAMPVKKTEIDRIPCAARHPLSAMKMPRKNREIRRKQQVAARSL